MKERSLPALRNDVNEQISDFKAQLKVFRNHLNMSMKLVAKRLLVKNNIAINIHEIPKGNIYDVASFFKDVKVVVDAFMAEVRTHAEKLGQELVDFFNHVKEIAGNPDLNYKSKIDHVRTKFDLGMGLGVGAIAGVTTGLLIVTIGFIILEAIAPPLIIAGVVVGLAIFGGLGLLGFLLEASDREEEERKEKEWLLKTESQLMVAIPNLEAIMGPFDDNYMDLVSKLLP